LLAHRTGGAASAQQARNARHPPPPHHRSNTSNRDLPSLLGPNAAIAAAAAHKDTGLGLAGSSPSSSSLSSSSSSTSPRALGVLIPLRCGHNAAYSQGELKMLRHHVEAVMATWQVEADEEGGGRGMPLV